jgi:RNA polymerase sigma-70 factor (ECF subfamily)
MHEEPSLLESFRRGERRALGEVYARYAPQVLEYLSRLFPGSPLGALDLEAALQETFVRAFRNESRQSYDGVRPYAAFLMAIARASAIDLFRSVGKVAHHSIPLDVAPEALAAPSPEQSPEEKALADEAKALVLRFLETCTDEERALAVARFVDGLSQQAAAERLGLSRGEVRHRERRFREAFTRHIFKSGWLERAPADATLSLVRGTS